MRISFTTGTVSSVIGLTLLSGCGRPAYDPGMGTANGGSLSNSAGSSSSMAGTQNAGGNNPAGGVANGGTGVVGMGGMIDTQGGSPPQECLSYTAKRVSVMPDATKNTEAVNKVAGMTLAQRLKLMYGFANCDYNSGDQCFQQQALPEAGVPKWSMRDGPRGVRTMGTFPSTSFPCAMARAASFDLALEQDLGALVAEEMLGFKWDLMLAPTINVLRHPAWGRAQETYGEDPVLLGEMGAAYVRGIQGGGIPACIKHFAANNSEDNRTTVTANMDEQTLRENYTRQFEIAVMKADPACFMASYNKINGVFAAENPKLLTDILRTEWQWQGMVLSDWGATKSTVPSAKAGLDLEMPNDAFFGNLGASVPGQVPGERIIEAVQRNMNVRYTFKQMSTEYQNRAQNTAIVDAQTHRDLALKAAREGMVLLRNTDNLLPFAAGANILVAGPDANVAHLGDRGSSEVNPKAAYVVSPLAGLQAAAQTAGATVTSAADLTSAVAQAPGKTAVILVVSMVHQDEGEGFNMGGDRDNLNLAGPHPVDWTTKPAAWINQLAAANPNLIVVLNVGGAVVEPTLDKAKGLVQSFYPGQAGGTALGELLFGTVNFSGKLPFTVASQETDYPTFGNSGASAAYDYLHGYRKFDGEGLTPKFYFGSGISYTTFTYANQRVACPTLSQNGLLVSEVDVTNSGKKAGTEIVQLYIGYPKTAVRRPKKELKAFARVSLEPGETKTVQLNVPAKDLAYWKEGAGWTVELLEHQALLGPSADPATLMAVPFTIN
jgi:beta-glucosidase